MAEQSQAAPKMRASKKNASAASTKPGTKHNWVKPFLAALADTSNVAAAARAAHIDPSTAYHRRRTNAGFNREWQIALCEGYDNLEMELLHRLRTGEIKPAAGAKRAVRSFDNATAFRLLAVHRENAVRERAVRQSVSAAEIRDSIDRKVEELRQRVLAAKAEREAGRGSAAAAAGMPHGA
jgi:hypothetical protein